MGVAMFGLTASTAVASASAATLNEAGSSLVYPLVARWSQAYHSVTISTAPGGSGVGQKDIIENAVDIGGSDAPMSASNYSADPYNAVEIPWALTATGVGYNVPGVGSGLRLTPAVIAEIFTGRLRSWSAAPIVRLNQHYARALRRAGRITPVFRSDGSGDSFAFQNFMYHAAPKIWTTVPTTQFPTTVGIGENGNAGVAGEVHENKGTIGYISAYYLLDLHITTAAVQNAAGNFEFPDPKNIADASLSNSRIPAQGSAFTAANGVPIQWAPKRYKIAYPIATYTYAIVNKGTQPHGGLSFSQLQAFLSWAITSGQRLGGPLDFVPLPKSIVNADQALINSL
ncbi:MAG: phosphate ABC transporter substrate-binding protein PstS [Actinomycetota bacterium]|nr:phosphate ABC transporter substrate-binding protein PstS [Actinomycetota bacterium]